MAKRKDSIRKTFDFPVPMWEKLMKIQSKSGDPLNGFILRALSEHFKIGLTEDQINPPRGRPKTDQPEGQIAPLPTDRTKKPRKNP